MSKIYMLAEKRRTPKMTIKTKKETLADVGAGLCCIIPPYVLDHLRNPAMRGFVNLP